MEEGRLVVQKNPLSESFSLAYSINIISFVCNVVEVKRRI